ncbi:ATP-dependent RNA helicase DHX30-like isoform X2 [Periplaneta americana]|uniref:ATP-dependent RNA helicase DHX30-like isoform X2 n=1 Tax=Periplaneta americana TaxID=6978 RepID=UPI0037E8FA24
MLTQGGFGAQRNFLAYQAEHPLNFKWFFSHIPSQVLTKLKIDTKLKYTPVLNLSDTWKPVLLTQCHKNLRSVGFAVCKKRPGSTNLLHSIRQNSTIFRNVNFKKRLSPVLKQIATHKDSETTVNSRNCSSFVRKYKPSVCKRICLPTNSHWYTLNKIEQCNIMLRTHTLSDGHLLSGGNGFSGGPMICRMESTFASQQESDNTAKKIDTTKVSRHSKNRKRKSEEVKENDETSDNLEEETLVNISPKELEAVEGRFPHPKGTLHNLYAVVAQELGSSDCLQKSYRVVPVRTGKSTNYMWCCTYRVNWPSITSFSATMSTKAAAGKQAALKALHWLQTQGKLTKTGAPLLYDKKEIKGLSKLPLIMVDPDSLQDIDTLVKWYRKDIEPLLSELDAVESQKELTRANEEMTEEIYGAEVDTNPITGFVKKTEDSKAIARRNMQLYSRYLQRTGVENGSIKSPGFERERKQIEEMRRSLPITQFREQIVKMIDENPVIVVKGEPGCGKSTQVPQYIMEHYEGSKRGAHCNVIITQPRRLSAISLAEWVAFERQEKVGDVVGYQVRFKSAIPRAPGGVLLYCSTGILLRRIQNNPGLLGASHVVLDEAHERNINTDVLLVLLRRAIALNPELRVIVMSATINAELFRKYFDNAPVLSVPGFTYPVKSYFAEDLDILSTGNETTLCNPAINCSQVATVINWIDKHRPEGAILCFLPGWTEISSVLNYLEGDRSRIILPVHSRLSHEDQRRIFSNPPPGIRKIILATNIAETSITINDVVYVIDTGAQKEERLNIRLGVSTLGNQWVSQANVNQRKGRAGRVQPGECYHMYSRHTFENLNKFPIPELLRLPLEQTVLDCKTYSQNEKAADFLSQMPEPPSLDSVRQAVVELINLDALDDDENLTPLGRRIAMFTTHPKLSKAMIHSAIFRCVSPILSIATLLSSDAEMFHGGLRNKENVRLVKKNVHSSSDHLALAWLYEEWETLLKKSTLSTKNFCSQKGLNSDSMRLISKLRELYVEHLLHSRMLEDIDKFQDLNAACNKCGGNSELVKAVLLSGTGTLLYRRSWDVINGRLKKNTNVILTETGQRTSITSESVNFKRTNFPSPFYTYFRQVQSVERRSIIVRETSLVSPLTVLLFTPGKLSVKKYVPPTSSEDKWNDHVLMKISRRQDITMMGESSQAQHLADLRIILWNLINYFIMKEGVDEDNERYQNILGFHERLLQVLCSLMYKAGATVECEEEKSCE